MREVLHQLTMALALPIAVSAVWAIRGNPADSSDPLLRATPYRVALAALPLPSAERLREPREPRDWRVRPHAIEDPVGPIRRAALPEIPASASLARVTPADSEREGVAVAAPRATQPEVEPASSPDALPLRWTQAEVSTAPLVAVRSAATRASRDLHAAATPVPVKPSAVKPSAYTPEPSPSTQRSVASVDAAPAVRENLAKPAPAVSEIPAKPVVSAAAVKPALSATVAHPAPAVVAVRSTPTSVRRDAPVASAPDRGGIEKGWHDGFAAAASSPALANAIRETHKGIDLSLADRGRAREHVDVMLPIHEAAAPALALLAASDRPLRSELERFVSETLPGLRELSLPTQDAFAAAPSDGRADFEDEGFPSSRGFLPVLTLLAIPEPTSAALVGATLATLALVRRRGRQR